MNEFLKRFLTSFIIIFVLSMNWACEEIPDGVIDPEWSNETITEINVPASFTKTADDSIFAVFIKFENGSSIKEVYAKLLSKTGEDVHGVNLLFNRTADSNTDFEGRVLTTYSMSSGDYILEFYLIDNEENIKKVAAKTFSYDNGQTPQPPVISNLTIPNSVSRGESFIFSIKVTDANGLSDVDMMTFKLYRPDGSIVQPTAGQDYFFMNDTGNLQVFGDDIAGDGIYSFKNSFGASSAVGSWKFEFQAFDKSGAGSNIIIHNIEVN